MEMARTLRYQEWVAAPGAVRVTWTQAGHCSQNSLQEASVHFPQGFVKDCHPSHLMHLCHPCRSLGSPTSLQRTLQ